MAERQHEPGCPADHDCGRDHPDCDVYHPPIPCTCGGIDWRARCVAMEAIAREAIGEFEDALGYVPSWAVERWGYREALANLWKRLDDAANGRIDDGTE